MSLLPELAPRTVTVRAPAKVNVYLGVGRLRPDGFHPLETVYQAVSLYDDVTVEDAATWSVRTVGEPHVDLAAVPDDDSNIAVRAGRALAAHHGVERAAAITVHKGIPVAGGMAGGSADAAATLLALDRLWQLDTTDDELFGIAASLGSDVPFALLGGTAAGTGRGEVVEPLPDNGTWWWVVVFNEEGLSTSSVYAAYDVVERGDHDHTIRPGLRDALVEGDPDRLAVYVYNDLEPAAFDLRPDLERICERGLECGALVTVLSGSGPTVLGLARGADDARRIAHALRERGHDAVAVVHGPVAGAHVVSYG